MRSEKPEPNLRPEEEPLDTISHFWESAWAVIGHPILLVGLGSAVGGVSRYYLGRAVDSRTGSVFPWGTLTINAIGSFVLAVLTFVILERMPHGYRWLYLLFGTGLCGGFTTFSTFSVEIFRLLRDGHHFLAIAYMATSFAAGLLGVLLAVMLVRCCLGKM